jgi:selT/selW/selH-like putative selenoprotein
MRRERTLASRGGAPSTAASALCAHKCARDAASSPPIVCALAGDLFPPAYLNVLASQLLQYIFFVGLFLMLAGEFVFTSVVPAEPVMLLVRRLKENQMPVIIALFVCNMIATNLLSTGAFEVMYDGELVFSRLDTGLVPDAHYLLERLKNFHRGNALN